MLRNYNLEQNGEYYEPEIKKLLGNLYFLKIHDSEKVRKKNCTRILSVGYYLIAHS